MGQAVILRGQVILKLQVDEQERLYIGPIIAIMAYNMFAYVMAWQFSYCPLVC